MHFRVVSQSLHGLKSELELCGISKKLHLSAQAKLSNPALAMQSLNGFSSCKRKCALIKKCKTSNVRNCIIDNGFQVVKSTRTTISKHQAAAFYSEHKDRFFYNRLLTFMSSGPSDIYILAREDAIKKWRELMGPTKVYQAVYTAQGTIRALYGLSDTRNATHGSDSPESACREISIFFPEFDREKWLKDEEPYFREGKVVFDEDGFVHHALK